MIERGKKFDLAMGPFYLSLTFVSRKPWVLGCLGRIADWLEQ